MWTIVGGLLVVTGTLLVADGARFSDFTPLTNSAGATADESAPITFGNPRSPIRTASRRSTPATARSAPGQRQ
jgi:hypothetical protein